MKVRKGFVSNSSTSSFILVGRKLAWSEFFAGEYNPEKLMFVGESDEADDVWRPGQETIDAVKEHAGKALWFDFDAYEAYVFGEGSVLVHKADVPDTFIVMAGECGYWPPQDVQEFRARYFGEGEEEE